MTILKLLGVIALLGVLVPAALVPPSTVLAHLLVWIEKLITFVWGCLATPFRILGRFWKWAGSRIADIVDSLKAKTAERLGEPDFGAWMLVRPLIEAVVAGILAVAYAIFLADTLPLGGFGTETVTGGASVLLAAIFANTVGLWKFGEAIWGDPPTDSPAPPKVVGYIGLASLVVFDVSLGLITVMVQRGSDPGWLTAIPRVGFLLMLICATVIVGLRIPRIVEAMAIVGLSLARVVTRLLEVAAQAVVFALELTRRIVIAILVVAAAIGRGFWNWATRTGVGQRLGIHPIEELEVVDLVDVIDPLIDRLIPFLAEEEEIEAVPPIEPPAPPLALTS